MALFEISLLVNVARWQNLVYNFQNPQHSGDITVVIFIIFSIILSIFYVMVTLAHLVYKCKGQDQTANIDLAELELFTLSLTNLYSVVCYIISLIFFKKLYNKLRVATSNLVSSSQEVTQIRKNSNALTCFFVSIIIVIIYREAIYLYYQFGHNDINNGDSTSNSGYRKNKIYQFGLYTSDYALLIILSISIKKTLETQNVFKDPSYLNTQYQDTIQNLERPTIQNRS